MFDIGEKLKDAGAVTSSGYGQVDASAQVVELGNGLVRGNVIIEISNLVMQGNDQLYQLALMGGDAVDFSGSNVNLAMIEVGAKEMLEDALDSKLGRYLMPFENEKNGVTYPYVRIRHIISGTSPSINYTARMEPDLSIRGAVSQANTTTTT